LEKIIPFVLVKDSPRFYDVRDRLDEPTCDDLPAWPVADSTSRGTGKKTMVTDVQRESTEES
jgi:hypothetical protein